MGVSALIFMAGEANFRLSLPVPNLVGWCMNYVTTIAGHLVVLVLATFPVGASGAFMASQALRRQNFVFCCCIGPLLENDIRRCTAFDVWITLQVLFTFTVTTLTSGRAWIAFDAMLGLVNSENRR